MERREISCQIRSVPLVADRLKWHDVIFQRIKKLRRSTKRRVAYLQNVFGGSQLKDGRAKPSAGRSLLQAGDIVVVRPRREIEATLDNWNTLHRCGFMEEMWKYCGTRQRVLKRVERFLDERDYLLKRTNGMVILENVLCEGTIDFGKCDRTCFYFWREEWLEKAGGPELLH